MKKLLPEESPKDIWNKLVAAAKAGDLKTALTLSTGDWETLVHKKSNDDPDKLKREFSQIPFEIGKEKIGTKDKAKTATLGLIVEGNNVITLEFVLDKKANKWLIAGYDEKHSNRRHGRSRVISNMNNLKQIGLACRMYSNVYNENFPAKLDDLKTEGFLENEAIYLWTDSKTGKKFPFIYAPGYNEADRVETMIAAAPKAVNGKREVLWLDGHVKTISENKFIKNAKKQKWKLPGLVKKEEVPEEIQKKVRELIAKLADSDFNVRKTAKEKLIKMGDSAYPFLEENKNNQDPEVKMTIKEILEK